MLGNRNMKIIFLTLFCCLSFSLMASAQASGGQIRRPEKTQSNVANRSVSRTASPSRKAAKTYTAREMYEMGQSFYDKGDYKEAMSWYLKAAENGYSDAQSELGFMYMNGEGVPVNKSEGAKWLIKAGENGDAMAQRALGFMYKNGDGVYKSETESQKWFREVAPKIYDLSKKLMKTGNQQCVNFFEEVVDMGITPYNVWSLFHLGAIFYYGEGGQKTDFSKSFRYFRLAADKGNKPAKYYLGLCFEYGRGIPKDITRAKEYYKQSGYEHVPSRDF